MLVHPHLHKAMESLRTFADKKHLDFGCMDLGTAYSHLRVMRYNTIAEMIREDPDLFRKCVRDGTKPIKTLRNTLSSTKTDFIANILRKRRCTKTELAELLHEEFNDGRTIRDLIGYVNERFVALKKRGVKVIKVGAKGRKGVYEIK